MMKRAEYTTDRFTEKEILFAHTVADAVCKVFGIENSELRGVSRKSLFTDARKVFAHYLSSNIVLEKVSGSYHVALATWYLNQHHSTICYAVEQANNLYRTDALFRSRYDNVIGLMADPYNFQVSVIEQVNKEPKEKVKLTWEDVRMTYGYTHRFKEQLLPINVSQRIKELYRLGYSFIQIAYQVGTTDGFISYYVKKNNFQRGEFATNITTKRRAATRVVIPYYSSSIDY